MTTSYSQIQEREKKTENINGETVVVMIWPILNMHLLLVGYFSVSVIGGQESMSELVPNLGNFAMQLIIIMNSKWQLIDNSHFSLK